MAIQEEHIAAIEKFLSGEMSEGEKGLFEARVAEDAIFRESFEEYQTLEVGLKDHFINDLKSNLQTLDKALDGNQESKETEEKVGPSFNFKAWKWLAAAAVVLPLLIYIATKSNSPEQLAQDYWVKEPGLPVQMSQNSQWNPAMTQLKKGEWRLAKEALISMNPSDTTAYFLGVVSFELEAYENAVEKFNDVEDDSFYYPQALYRLAITKIALNQKEEALRLLQQNQELFLNNQLQVNDLMEDLK